MAFRVLNVQVKVDLYMVCYRSQLHNDLWAFVIEKRLLSIEVALFACEDNIIVIKLTVTKHCSTAYNTAFKELSW